MAAITKEQAIEFLSNLDPMQLRVLAREVEAKWGLESSVSPFAPASAYGIAAIYGASLTGWPVEEFLHTVTLLSFGDRVQTIRQVREITGWGLLESKNLVDHLPRVLKSDLREWEAKELAEKFKGICKVQIDRMD